MLDLGNFMADPIRTANLDSTISALQQGLSSISSDEAIDLIESWAQLIGANISFSTLDEDLDRLKLALMGVTDYSIAAAIAELGENTTKLADSLDGELANKVKQLGDLLSQAATTL